jgi:RNA-directed DNA polymerase
MSVPMRGAGARRRCHEDLRSVIADINLVLRGWGAYFRSGNAAIKFVQIDRFAEDRLSGLRVKRAGSQLRPGQAEQWRRPFFEALGLHRLGGTIQYPAGGIKPLPTRPLGSRVREIRTHGLNGGAARVRCGVAGGSE